VLWLTDLGSSNGTYVNGVRLNSGEKASVRSGDRLRIGDVELTLSVED
jgi:pSer/pThr/pTyr-binding forkhead associated (FHA) protein